MFNKFEPLDKTNPQLVEQLERVTQRGGLNIPRDRMFLMKASEKVTTLNAYVTGFGPSKRVVVWDTTIQKASTPETLFVFGHEMGHYVLNHVVIGLTASAVGLFIGLFLLYRLSGWFLHQIRRALADSRTGRLGCAPHDLFDLQHPGLHQPSLLSNCRPPD